MKVLFVALGVYTGVGGLERFNQRVVTSLSELGAAEGVESRAIALWDAPGDGAAAPAMIHFSPGGRNKLRTAAAFTREVRRLRPHVVLYGHVLLAPLATLGRLLSPGARHLMFVHGREVWREPFRNRVPLWERLAVRSGIDGIAAVSRLTAERMRNAYGLPPSMFRLLPNAVDAPASAPRNRNGAGRERRLVTVTRLSSKDRYKGCDHVIRALPRVLAEIPDARYELVGDGPLKPELERFAREVGVLGAMRFRGYVSDQELEEIYDQAQVMVMPSTGEGFGIVFLEAWKHGLPVVVGNQDASAEVVTHGVNGLCVDPLSEEAIAKAVIELLRDPQRAAAMGECGYQTVLDRYTHHHFRQNLWQILQG